MESLPCEPTEAFSLNISIPRTTGNQDSLFRIQAPPRDQKVPHPCSGWKRELPSRRSEALAKMREADVFSLPSYAETFGLAYLEAMSQGAVAVGSRGEGIDGVIEDGENGYLLDAKDERGLTALLTRLWHMDGDEWDRVVENAHTTAGNMSRRAMAKKYLEDAVMAAKETGL